jgi:hypothetical protein
MHKALIFGLCLSLLNVSFAEEAKTKKKMNTNIFESEAAGSAFTAKVKTFKKSQGDYLVYFEDIKKSGPYVLPEAIKNFSTLQNRIAKSAGKGGPQLHVTVDDQDNITSVSISEGDEPKN